MTRLGSFSVSKSKLSQMDYYSSASPNSLGSFNLRHVFFICSSLWFILGLREGRGLSVVLTVILELRDRRFLAFVARIFDILDPNWVVIRWDCFYFRCETWLSPRVGDLFAEKFWVLKVDCSPINGDLIELSIYLDNKINRFYFRV